MLRKLHALYERVFGPTGRFVPIPKYHQPSIFVPQDQADSYYQLLANEPGLFVCSRSHTVLLARDREVQIEDCCKLVKTAFAMAQCQ